MTSQSLQGLLAILLLLVISAILAIVLIAILDPELFSAILKSIFMEVLI